MEEDTQRGIAMISAASHALKALREHRGDVGQAMNDVSRFVREQRNEQTKIGMIAAASKAIEIAERNPEMSDRNVINQLMVELDSIIAVVRQHSGKN